MITTEQKVVLGILEAIALAVIVRLWWRGGKTSLLERVVWTLVLVVPLLGILIYAFLRINPDENSDDNVTFSERAEAENDNRH